MPSVTDILDGPVPAFDSRPGLTRHLVAWFYPYLRGHRLLLVRSLFATVLVLACQLSIPLVVDGLLHKAVVNHKLMAVLIGLVAVQIVGSFEARRAAHVLVIRGATALRGTVFDRLLRSDVVHQRGMARTSLVSRHTSDVDHVATAFEGTVVEGVPALIRIALSLVLLIVIEWHAGLVMALACVLFLLLRSRIGRTLMVRDRARLDSNSHVSERTDESISASRLSSGLNTTRWQHSRFWDRIRLLETATHKQGLSVIQLVVGAEAAGLIGLTVVVFSALTLGANALSSVVAALLYVEGVVRGLEALPPWVRSVQFGVVSQIRIDQILTSPDRICVPTTHESQAPHEGFALVDLSASSGSAFEVISASILLPANCIIGLVTPTGTDPEWLLGLLAGQENPDSGRVQLDDVDVRMPSVRQVAYFVPSEAAGFNTSVLDWLRAADSAMDEAGALSLLNSVMLGHLVDLPAGLTRPLGPMGSQLSAGERQLLSVAVALAAQPRVLLVGSLRSLADPETARSIVSRLRQANSEYTVVSVHDPEVAELADIILFVGADGTHLGTHQELLVNVPGYSRLWEQRLTFGGVDLSVLGIAESEHAGLQTRLVTEQYAPGDFIYREGAPADRIIFTISGQIEIQTSDATGAVRRVAVLGPGNHCGDLRLAVGERRAESAVALDSSVVRSLSREAISAGMMGLLDRTPVERRIVASILKQGSATAAEVAVRLPDVDPALVASSIAMLTNDGALRSVGDVLSVVQKRSVKSGASKLFDRLGDL